MLAVQYNSYMTWLKNELKFCVAIGTVLVSFLTMLPAHCTPAYMVTVQRKIKLAWHPPEKHKTKVVKVRFKIVRDGTVSDLKIHQSSGSSEADKAALDAVVSASPLPELPAGAPPDVLIEFTFDYKILGIDTSTFESRVRAMEKVRTPMHVSKKKRKSQV